MEMFRIDREKVSAPYLFCIFFSVTLIILALMGCEEREQWLEDPSRYLETKEFPGYVQRIPFYGINGHSGLYQVEAESACSVSGIYVEGASGAFLRSFNDSILFHIPLKETLPYASELTLIEAKGKVVQDRTPFLSEMEILSTEEVGELHRRVVASYPGLMERIGSMVANPKSKLDLSSIETFHCAASGDRLLFFGRTYDLMYEFDLAFLFEKEHEKEYSSQKEHNSFYLKHIYAYHLFKGE
jgi:hypothetical protein